MFGRKDLSISTNGNAAGINNLLVLLVFRNFFSCGAQNVGFGYYTSVSFKSSVFSVETEKRPIAVQVGRMLDCLAEELQPSYHQILIFLWNVYLQELSERFLQ